MALKQDTERVLKDAMQIMVDSARAELRAQGHEATGKLIRTLRLDSISNARRVVGLVYAEDYGLKIDRFLSPSQLPGRATLAAQLQRSGWVDAVKPGLSPREKTSFAFTVAAKMKLEGSPTKGAFQFSRNGRRTRWIEFGIASKSEEVRRQVEINLLPIITRQLGQMLARA